MKQGIGNLQIQILELLKSNPMYGYEIIQKLSDFKLNTAILYPALKQLEEMGLIKSFLSSQARGPKKRKNYELTENGFEVVQNLYDMKQIPTSYIDSFSNELKMLKGYAIGKKCLVIDSTKFLNIEALLNTKTFYNNKIPQNIDLIRYYDFKLQEKTDKYDVILLGFPFFINYEIDDALKESLVSFFKKVKASLNANGVVWVLDLVWDRHAVIETFAYLIAGNVKKMGFKYEEMQELFSKATFKNFDLIKSEKGIILFSVV